MQPRPSFAAAAAVARAWLDCMPPAVIKVSQPVSSASCTANSSFRTLFPDISMPV